MSAIHHFVPVLHRGDAVGRHTLRLCDAARARGFASEIFVETVDEETVDETRSVLSYPERAAPGDVLVYQFATASAMAPWLAARPETLVVNYHNITPPEYYAPWDNAMARHQLRAQHELRLLAGRAALAVADSAFNETHLEEAGFATTRVIPPVASLGTVFEGTPTSAGPRPERPQGARWLAVGRVSPNKAFESTIAALAVTRAHRDPDATLQIVGKTSIAPYAEALRRYVVELGLSGAVRFTGHVRDAAVARAYEEADVLVVTSEHEGFCVPVVEALAAGLPVVALDRGAVLEVLGRAGVVLPDADPYTLAGAIGALLADGGQRAALVESGRQRLDQLDLASAADRFIDQLTTLIVSGGGPSA